MSEYTDIKISIAKEDIVGKMYDITSKVMSFTDFGRCPDESEWLKILELLKEWDRLRVGLEVLNDI